MWMGNIMFNQNESSKKQTINGESDPSANGEAAVSEECRNRNFQQRQLDAHNEYRALHGADALEYDPELAAAAQAYAEHLAGIDKMKHDPNLRELKQGENLAWQWSSRAGAAATATIYGTKGVDDWYDEVNTTDYFAKFDINKGLIVTA